MCLQGVLEGKPVLIKKIGQVIVPAPGFNVIVTANTKGRGSDDGRFSAANIIDEAFLERFNATIDQPYAQFNVEKTIVLKHMEQYGVRDLEFADKLVAWSQVIRKTFENDGVDDVISTRRLCHIAKAHSIFNDRTKSIAMCIARFDADTKAAFSDLYTKIDSQAVNDPAPSDQDEEIDDLGDIF
jgi:MoxR-like ATPase